MVEVSLGRVGLCGSRDICELSHFYVRVDLFLDQVVSTRQLCCKHCTAFRAKERPERLNAYTCTYGIIVAISSQVNELLLTALLDEVAFPTITLEQAHNTPPCAGRHLIRSSISFGNLQRSGEYSPNSATLTGALVTESHSQADMQKQLIEVTSRTLDIPRSRMCVISHDHEHPW